MNIVTLAIIDKHDPAQRWTLRREMQEISDAPYAKWIARPEESGDFLVLTIPADANTGIYEYGRLVHNCENEADLFSYLTAELSSLYSEGLESLRLYVYCATELQQRVVAHCEALGIKRI